VTIPHFTHPDRSEFYPLIREALRNAAGKWPLEINLNSKGGYAGSINVRITKATEQEFETDREFTDSTRFPARIRAACTALRDEGCFGSFTISHTDGDLTISLA